MNTAGAVILGTPSAVSGLNWEQKAWRFYSPPDGTNVSGVRTNQGAIGEVRHIMGWIAQQVGRVTWHVDIDGDRLDDKEAAAMISQVGNEESTSLITTNLVVAGRLTYVALTPAALDKALGGDVEAIAGLTLPGVGDKRWYPVSVVDDKRAELLEAAKAGGLMIPALWPHPAKPTVADPPIRAVIDVLEEIEQLQDLAYSQNRSRIAQMGILTVANELDLHNTLPNGRGGNAATDIENVINSPINDPRRSSAAPIIFRAPFEYLTGALSNGARAVQWTQPVRDFDDSIEGKMRFAIQRLAWGFPIPPEALLGMNSANRAVAFQVEESTYRSHIEPIARIVARIYAKALSKILQKEEAEDGEVDVKVSPDPTDLLARRHSVADAKDLYDRGIAGAKYVRKVTGVDEEDAATEEDLRRIERLRGKINGGGQAGPGRENDPSEVAGNEPVRAAAAVDGADLAHGLKAAIDVAQTNAVARVGAAARTRLGRIPATPTMELDPAAVPNKRLPSLLGPDRLAQLNLDMNAAIGGACEHVVDWLETRLAEDGHPAHGTDLMREAVGELRQGFYDLCCATACTWPITRLPVEAVEKMLYRLEPGALESGPSEGET